MLVIMIYQDSDVGKGPFTYYISQKSYFWTTHQLSVQRRRKKHGLLVEVESLVSSSKKNYNASTQGGPQDFG